MEESKNMKRQDDLLSLFVRPEEPHLRTLHQNHRSPAAQGKPLNRHAHATRRQRPRSHTLPGALNARRSMAMTTDPAWVWMDIPCLPTAAGHQYLRIILNY